MALRHPQGPAVSGLALGGAGATDRIWVEVLAGTTGLAVTARRSGQAASAGAALLAARATGDPWDLDRLDPVTMSFVPDPAVVDVYAGLRAHDDAVASSVLGLGAPPEGGRPCG
jgi:sugar (pentulose or hexulose) kinase